MRLVAIHYRHFDIRHYQIDIRMALTADDATITADAMASAGINCCSKSISTTCSDLSGNEYKDYECFTDYANPHLL